jgi:hypothetical protein
MIETEFEQRKKKMARDVLRWEECYERFKDKFDELEGYERRIRTLENELERRSKVFGVFKKDKNWLQGVTLIYIILSFVFVTKIVAKIGKPWLFFLAGLLIGICGTALLNIWIEIEREALGEK